jgi:hypothetical protein
VYRRGIRSRNRNLDLRLAEAERNIYVLATLLLVPTKVYYSGSLYMAVTSRSFPIPGRCDRQEVRQARSR